MRWSKGANGGGLKSKENHKKDTDIKNESKVSNRDGGRGLSRPPRNKVDQNSSMPMSHYLLCQLCRPTC